MLRIGGRNFGNAVGGKTSMSTQKQVVLRDELPCGMRRNVPVLYCLFYRPFKRACLLERNRAM